MPACCCLCGPRTSSLPSGGVLFEWRTQGWCPLLVGLLCSWGRVGWMPCCGRGWRVFSGPYGFISVGAVAGWCLWLGLAWVDGWAWPWLAWGWEALWQAGRVVGGGWVAIRAEWAWSVRGRRGVGGLSELNIAPRVSCSRAGGQSVWLGFGFGQHCGGPGRGLGWMDGRLCCVGLDCAWLVWVWRPLSAQKRPP